MGKGWGSTLKPHLLTDHQVFVVICFVFLRMYVLWGWQGERAMEITNSAICRVVLTKILIVIISWRWDLECFNFFFEILLLFKHFTKKKYFVTFAVRGGSQELIYFFILQYLIAWISASCLSKSAIWLTFLSFLEEFQTLFPGGHKPMGTPYSQSTGIVP